MRNRNICGLLCLVVLLTLIYHGDGQMSAEVLWTSCQTLICGPRQLILQCEKNYKININNVTSGRDALFDRRSYTNLLRMCMGMTVCDPGQVNFCTQHNNVQFTVNYTCVHDSEIENTCNSAGTVVKGMNGFITSPNYPFETNYRYCKWKIHVPDNYYIHIFIHEISSSSSHQCDGLIFQSKETCGMPFPTYPICDQYVINTISACADTEVILTSADKNLVRFWLSYYVLPVSDIRHALLYDVGLTCGVHHKEQFTYSDFYNQTVLIQEEPESIENITYAVTTAEGNQEENNFAMYVFLIVGLVVLVIILLVVVIVYLRYRLVRKEDTKSISGSTSQNNVSDIQKRPLPERHTSSDLITSEDEPVLQQGYSVVVDELREEMTASSNMASPTYATYAEIEELSEGGETPKSKLMAKRSIDSSKRQLPEKPNEEPLPNHYYDIEVKDKDTEKKPTKPVTANSSEAVDVDDKNKKNKERKYPNFFYKKKLSNASNIYAECADIMTSEKEKTYMDMSHRQINESDYVPHGKAGGESVKSKDSKDKVNLCKRSLVKGPNATYAECADVRKSGEATKGGNKSKNESVTTDSDSDDDISMVENELYEPFESAKV